MIGRAATGRKHLPWSLCQLAWMAACAAMTFVAGQGALAAKLG
jgi:hypothetical protein